MSITPTGNDFKETPMTVTFFAVQNDQVVTTGPIAEWDIRLSNTSAYNAMLSLGMEVDYLSHPAGEVPADEFLRMVEDALSVRRDAVQVERLLLLRGFARDAQGLDTVAWG